MSVLTEKYANPQYYHNRELSWLQFDRRCLSEARNKDNPLFERLKFLSITASNLDEFFMVRVASLQDMVNANYRKRDIAGMTASEQLDAILADVHAFMQRQYSTYNRQLVQGLRENGLDIVEDYEDLTPEERGFVDAFFEAEVFPVLTPMAVDNARPFPLVRNKSLNLCALLSRKAGTGQGIPGYMRKPKKADKDRDGKDQGGKEKDAKAPGLKEKDSKEKDAKAKDTKAKDVKEKDGRDSKDKKTVSKDAKAGNYEVTAAAKNAKAGKAGKDAKEKDVKEKENFQFATVQVPAVLPRILELPSKSSRRIILLEEIIRHHLGSLFLNYDVLCAYPYRVTRNADLTIDEDDASDLLKEIEKQLKKRQRGYAIRLEVEEGMDPRLLEFLTKEFNVPQDRIFEIDGPLDLTFLMKLYGLDGFEWLREDRYAKPQEIAALPTGCDIFEQIRGGDIFMHHPYQTFQPVVDFIAQAADDPAVLAIKQTLYRVSGNSPIIAALARAAENGKQVTVLVELKARFDEENNIVWARMLERAGCHVIYGLAGLKTHSKITLVVRREDDGIRRYVHLATGNYNDSTAKLYTDIGVMTCRDDIGEDATSAFNMLSGYSEPRFWNHLSLAPLWLKDRFLYLINREVSHARNGEKGRIRAKMNSLCDPDIMAALYEASSAGVKIDLIVRGICCLKVGIPGVSENIRVRSIVGNFLEHSRIFYFENGGRPEVYAASADWMPRNLDRRVEILFPIVDRRIAEKVVHVLDVELADTVKAHILKPDGSYERVDKRGKELVDSQRIFCDEAVREAQAVIKPRGDRVFIPVEKKEEQHV
ncbi:MAG: polyphosphate kinase 1 [Eubacteriales bacterium]|nr:polyphosphate kinase 1 [Eubacteriales bacterium]